MDSEGSAAGRRNDPQAFSYVDTPEVIARELKTEMIQILTQSSNTERSRPSIFRFPGFLSGIEESVREPTLASIGPYYRSNENLLYVNDVKTQFVRKFEERASSIQILSQEFPDEKKIRDYYEDTNSIGDDFVQMVVTDGSFIVELFYQSAEKSEVTWPWIREVAADLLKMGNQLPFFVLETLFRYSNNQATSNQELTELALRFFNKVLGMPLASQNRQQPWHLLGAPEEEPKHLLDLFRSRFLPENRPRKICEAFEEHIQRAEILCEAGITLRRNMANSLLEIDFQKLQIPPYALKIPPLATDDLTSTILVNCAALEQCWWNASEYFTAYILFMSHLVGQPEDVRILQIANIISRVQSGNQEYVIKLFDSFARKVNFTHRDCYLWKQYKEINSFSDSTLAHIWSKLNGYNILALVVSILAAANGLFSWLFPKHGAN